VAIGLWAYLLRVNIAAMGRALLMVSISCVSCYQGSQGVAEQTGDGFYVLLAG
jgi:hypothetical protein